MGDRTTTELINQDLRDLMEVAGIPTHARPVSPRDVMRNEVIPWVKRAAWTYRYVEALEKCLSPEQIDAAVQEANGDRTITGPEEIGDVQGPDYGMCRCDGGRCGHPATRPDGFCEVCREPGLGCLFFWHGKWDLP